MNVKNQPVTLGPGTVIANFQGVEIVEKDSNHESGAVENEADAIPEYIQKLIDGVDNSVPENACIALQSILMKHADVFSQNENDLGRTDIIDNMLKQGSIEPASSPWASNVVLVKKKDGTLRCCIDYRQLNSVTRRDVYPLPRIDDCLDAMASATLFSTFDLRSSYHQVLVAPQDRDKTTFICPRGM